MAMSDKNSGKIDKKGRVISIADYLFANPEAKRKDIFIYFGSLWQISDRTLDRIFKDAQEYNKTRIDKVKQNANEDSTICLTDKQARFCYEYCIDYNASKAAMRAGYSPDTSYAIGCENLKKPNIQKYIEKLKNNLSETAGISALRVLKEHERIAFADAGQLRDGWMSLKDFENLSIEEKSIIKEVSTRETKYGTEVKIKLYDKQKSLDSISRMLGFDAPVKAEVTGKDGTPLMPKELMTEDEIVKEIEKIRKARNVK
jgi:phage terminase small subunit